MAHKIQNMFKMDDIVEHVLYEKNVGSLFTESASDC